MRETLEQAAKRMLKEPAGTERVIEINVNDGLTGLPPGLSARGIRMKRTTLRVGAQKRPDGKARVVVTAEPKGNVVAAGEWS